MIFRIEVCEKCMKKFNLVGKDVHTRGFCSLNECCNNKEFGWVHIVEVEIKSNESRSNM